MSDLIPLLLWGFSVVWSLGVCMICLVRGRFLVRSDRRRRPEVEPVSWNVVTAQAVSVVFAGLPFVVYRVYRNDFSMAMQSFYRRWLVVALIVVLLLIALEWLLMYVQARRADRTQIDRVLKR